MTVLGGNLCRHCLLPVGVRALRQTVNGESCAFCCYGCSIAFQVKNGKTEEWEAAWLLGIPARDRRLSVHEHHAVQPAHLRRGIYRRRCQDASHYRYPSPDSSDADGDHPRWSVFARDFG